MIRKWQCGICGYIHEGDAPPENCPICGAPRERFAPYEAEAPTSSPSDVPDVAEVDLIVVGSGAAGLSAACTALGRGASVLVLEKADTLGGTTVRSGGGYWIPCNDKQRAAGWEDNAQDAIRYMVRYSYPSAYNPSAARYGLPQQPYELIARYVENAPRMVRQLESLGALRSMMEINWTGQPQVDYMDHMPENKHVRGRSLYPMDSEGAQGMGTELIRQLMSYIKSHGGEVYTGQRVTEILRKKGRVCGVRVGAGDEARDFFARKGVVFGTGGFSRDPELMASLQRGPHYGGCSAPTNTGDFIRMAGSIGAALGNTAGAFRAQSMIDAYLEHPDGSSNVFYIPGDSVLLVNKYGKRFVNEKRNYNDRAMAHFQWDSGNAEWTNLITFMIFDERTATLWQGYPPYPVKGESMPRYLLHASNLTTLTRAIRRRLLNLAPHTGGFALSDSFERNLTRTLANFGEFARTGRDAEFHRGESAYDREWTTFPPTIPGVDWPGPGAKNPTMHPLQTKGPYYAILLAAGTLDTNGGPVINGDAQVLDWTGAPIPGLYGAGNCIASPTANAYWGAGSTIGPALTYGMIAAEHALRGDATSGG